MRSTSLPSPPNPVGATAEGRSCTRNVADDAANHVFAPLAEELCETNTTTSLIALSFVHKAFLLLT